MREGLQTWEGSRTVPNIANTALAGLAHSLAKSLDGIPKASLQDPLLYP